MSKIDKIKQESEKRLENHPALKFANDAIVLQALRTNTKGYEGETLIPFLRRELDLAYSAGQEEEAIAHQKEDINIRKEIVGKISAMKKNSITYRPWQTYNSALNEVLALLNNKEGI